MRGASSSAAADLRTCRSTLARVVLLLGAVAGQLGELVVGCRARAPPGERRLEQPLGDRGPGSGGSAPSSGCSPAPPGRSGPAAARPGSSTRVLARAQQLDDREREVGEAQRVGRAALRPGRPRAPARRAAAGSCSPSSAGERDDALPALGRRAARAGATGSPSRSRNRAVTPLAAIMKSSISSLARFFSSGRRSASTSPSNTALRLASSRARARRARARRAFMRLRDAVLEAQLLRRAPAPPPPPRRRRRARRARRPRAS